jgi:hypothetical protein
MRILEYGDLALIQGPLKNAIYGIGARRAAMQPIMNNDHRGVNVSNIYPSAYIERRGGGLT